MKKQKTENRRHYVMYGFEEDNPEHTAYLKISNVNEGKLGFYKLVYSADEATKFPAKNYSRKKGFGTPEQWAYFFAEEDELQDWNFHPILHR